jgi:rod shape determining protein RodA
MKFSSYLKQFDWFLFLASLFLVGVGMAAILSTTWGNENLTVILNKQIIAAMIGIALVFLLAVFNYQTLANYSYVIYIVTLLVLVGVLIFGQEIRGTRGWFNLGFFQFQPAELAKVALLIILSKYFSGISGKPSRIQYILISGAITIIPIGLIMMQPDLGSSLILISVWIFMLLTSGIKKEYVAGLVAIGVLVIGIAWTFLFAPYQKDRILSFVNPMSDPLGAGYHMIQSKIAVGSGQFLGRGLGHGTQSQLNFLPDQHTDFIFAVIAEELGFIGASLLLFLLIFLLLRIIKIARSARNEFGLMLALGSCFLFLTQILINVGMNVGILPVAGVPLPFVSYGGSALIFSLVVIGILESVVVRRSV